jgi:hypothetical protein
LLTRISRPFLCHLHWWHSHLLKFPWGTHNSCLSDSTTSEEIWIICKAWEMWVSCSESHLSQIHYFHWEYIHEFLSHWIHYWMIIFQVHLWHSSVSQFHQLLLMFHKEIFSCCSLNHETFKEKPEVLLKQESSKIF